MPVTIKQRLSELDRIISNWNYYFCIESLAEDIFVYCIAFLGTVSIAFVIGLVCLFSPALSFALLLFVVFVTTRITCQ